MCDRITQIQDQVNQLADHMCNAIGILQQSALPAVLPGRTALSSVPVKNEASDFQPQDLPALFAQLITRSAKELEVMIDHLPNENQAEELAQIEKLNSDNQKAGRVLDDTVRLGEKVLGKIQAAILEIGKTETELALLDSI